MTKMHLPIIGITMGDPTGIGPEIIVKVLSDKSTFRFCHPIILGDGKILERAITLLNSTLKVNEMRTIEEEEYKNGMLNLINLSHINIDEIEYNSQDGVLEAMCQLAEEVEKDSREKGFFEGVDDTENKYGITDPNSKYYSKQQVEELLQKQRELCADKTELTDFADEFLQEGAGDAININSILNAKLKLD